jgi:alginate O-acetyltransferase complex protein AlgI
MNFISWSFLILLTLVVAVRAWTGGRPARQRFYLGFLLCASLVFYGWTVPYYVLLLLFSTTVDWFAAKWIEDSPPAAGRRRKLLVAFSLVANLGMLAFFKYTNFFGLLLSRGLGRFGIDFHSPHLDLILPMGLSFYTFVALSYTIDVYRGELKAERSFWRFLLYVSFFPHLMAGPVIRAKDFIYQLYRKRTFNSVAFAEGGWLIVQGLFLKVVCANQLAVTIQRQWQPETMSQDNSVSLVMLVLLFSAQILCDFAGYSNLARGMAYWLGFRFPINFNNPYLAASFREFWQRWHITLSTWLRDYLYVPLGGNRAGKWKTYRNLLLTMVLGGLWHGAAITFVLWGALHGIALVIERWFKLYDLRSPFTRFGWFLVVQATVLVSWVFFRASGPSEVALILRGIVHLRLGAPEEEIRRAAIFILPVVVMHAHGFLVETRRIPPLGLRSKAVLAAGMLCLVMSSYGPNKLFIYFQF